MGYKIREKREELGITQDKLAEEANVSRAIISRLETGAQTDVKASTLRRIAIALHCNLSELLID